LDDRSVGEAVFVLLAVAGTTCMSGTAGNGVVCLLCGLANQLPTRGLQSCVSSLLDNGPLSVLQQFLYISRIISMVDINKAANDADSAMISPNSNVPSISNTNFLKKSRAASFVNPWFLGSTPGVDPATFAGVDSVGLFTSL
jgi:hypothetical protein